MVYLVRIFLTLGWHLRIEAPTASFPTLRTRCHDDSCQDFPSCMGGGEVFCQLTELIHHQARHCICQNLDTHTHTHTSPHTHTRLCQICQLTKLFWWYLPLEHHLPDSVSHSAPKQALERWNGNERKWVEPLRDTSLAFKRRLFEFGTTVII